MEKQGGGEAYVTVAEAARRYGHRSQWWYDRVADGTLRPYEIPGRRKGTTFLRVSEIEALLKPRPKRADE